MPGHPWILKPGPETFLDKSITVANPARIYFHAHLPSARVRDITLYHFPVSAGFAYLRRFHFGSHTGSCSLRMSPRTTRGFAYRALTPINNCSELILSAARLDYIADSDWDYVRIRTSLG
jgi:hypothetical protein